MISQYWVNQIPAKPLSIQVKNQDGTDMDLSSYTDIEVRMVGSNNELVDVSDAVLNTSNANIGKLIFFWPKTRSLFQYIGEYQLQVTLKNSTSYDLTTTHTMKVRSLGRLVKGDVFYR